MNTTVRVSIVVALAVGVAAVLVYKNNKAAEQETPNQIKSDDNRVGACGSTAESACPCEASSERPGQPQATKQPDPDPEASLPRLVDLGAATCIPCKMMAPILEELKSEYAGRLRVEFLDVRKDPSHGSKYGIRMIPTQIFFDGSNKELFRHEGAMSKEDILAKWRELGVTLD